MLILKGLMDWSVFFALPGPHHVSLRSGRGGVLRKGPKTTHTTRERATATTALRNKPIEMIVNQKQNLESKKIIERLCM